MYRLSTILILLIGLVFMQCGPKPPKVGPATVWTPPDPPESMKGMNLIIGRGISKPYPQRRLAVREARAEARIDIANQINTRVTDWIATVTDAVGSGFEGEINDTFKTVSKLMTEEALRFTNTHLEKEIPITSQKGTLYEYEVVIFYPLGAALANMEEEMQKKENLYKRYRTSEAAKEADKDIQEFREWKKKNGL